MSTVVESSQDLARLRGDIELARRVQLSLLPKELPSRAGLDMWAATRSAFDVGGDFYDFIDQPERPLTIVVADVSGKGMAAALFMAVTRRVLRTQANFRSMPSPATILAYTNAELYGDFTNSVMFATAFVAQYHPAQGQLVYANAGHSPVIYCRAGGKAEVLAAGSTALGIVPHSDVSDVRLAFGPGDVLVIGTDGLNETRNGEDRMFGYYGLKTTVEASAHLPPHAIVAALFEAVDRHSSSDEAQDDQTLVVLKYTGQ
jgi:sigma-B regulation protein RsbU (phosphoserine phosphatase)